MSVHSHAGKPVRPEDRINIGQLVSDYFLQKNDTITIAETGFGTGLNFLLTLEAYEKIETLSKKSLPSLHFISVEKYPLTLEELKSALSVLPELARFSQQLIFTSNI